MTTNNDDVFSQTISVLIVDADTESPDNTQAAFAKMGIGTDCYGNEEQALEMVRLHHARQIPQAFCQRGGCRPPDPA